MQVDFLAMAAVLVVLVSSCTAFKAYPLDSYGADELSYDEFVELYVKTRTPVVFRGFMSKVQEPVHKDGAREFLRKQCGSMPLSRSCEGEGEGEDDTYEEHSVRMLNESLRGQKWGSLQSANIEAMGIATISDLLDEQDRRHKSGEPQLYLHDASLSLLCPQVLDVFSIPKWFPFDFLSWAYNRQVTCDLCEREPYFPRLSSDKGDLFPRHLSKQEHGHSHQWPSLFIGPSGTQSAVHTDAFGTHFWMTMVEGTKEWLLFPVSDGPKLYPQQEINSRHGEAYDTFKKFAFDVFNPDYEKFPLAKEASAWTYNLTAGDVLFIPAGTPHAVRNLGHTVAYSYNLVDQHNLDYHIKVNLAEDNEWPTYSQGQIKLFEFIANVAELPLPTGDEEPLGEYYKRQHPLTVINIGDNRRKWHAFSNIPASISFEEWYNDEVRIPDSICVDDNVNCDTWMHDGECNNNGWMLHHCRRACGACDMDPNMIPTTLAHAPEGLMCHDRFTKCTTWAKEGSCESDSEVEWMTKNCPRACNKCYHGTAGCSDFSSNCRQWARQGQCEENREFMMLQCCSSCALLREGDDKPLYS